MRVDWKSILGCVVALVLVGFLGILWTQQAVAQMKGPADFAFPDGAMGKVVFSHAEHLEKGEKCTSCHTKIFKMTKTRSTLKMADMRNGEFCGACHNGKTAFGVASATNCKKCHHKE